MAFSAGALVYLAARLGLGGREDAGRSRLLGSQDQERRWLLLHQLSELANGEFRQVFVISHTDDVIQHSDLHILVEREPGQPSVAHGPQTAEIVTA